MTEEVLRETFGMLGSAGPSRYLPGTGKTWVRSTLMNGQQAMIAFVAIGDESSVLAVHH